MSASAFPNSVDAMLELLTSRGYLAERSLATVTYLALRMGRPLFLEGEAGVGKTEIAKVLSAALGRKLIRLQCYEGLDVASAVYEWNSAAQMIAIRLAEAAGDTDRDQLSSDIFAERYLIKRPLLQALEPDVAGAPVLLIDELDRADEAFEAYLLEILSDFQVTIPEFGTVKAPQPPIVIVTSNRTREIHDALKRRCLYHWVDYPSAERELAIVKSRVPGISAKLSQQVVGFVQALRAQDFYKSPGVAETIDWATALTELDARSLTPQVVGGTLGALLKYQDDIARMQGDTLQKVLKEATRENKQRPSFRGVAQRRTRKLALQSLDSGFALRAPRNDDGRSDGHRSSLAPNRSNGRQRRRLCPRAAGCRDSGRPRRGHRRAERAAGDRDRQPRRCVHHARGYLRQASRARAGVRAGVRPVLPRRRRLEAHAGFGAAAGSRQEKAAAGLAPGPGGALATFDERNPAGAGAGTQAFGLRQGSAAEEGFRADERGRDRASHPRHRQHEAAAGRIAHPPLSARCAGLAARHAPHPARILAHRRRHHRYPSAGADRQAGADRGAARYLRFDERVYAAVPAFPACHYRCPQARFGVSVRHPAHQCDAGAAGAGSRPGAGKLFEDGGGLGRRHPHRHLAALVQQIVGPARAWAGCDRAPDLRRAGARGRCQAGVRDGPAAPVLPPPDLAQSAVALWRLRGQGAGHQNDAAAR